MTNDQSNDRTEDFLRRHLDNYSDNPPESVWDGVANRLATPPPPPAARGWTLHHWMAAVIAALSIGLVAEFLYFSHRLEQLHQQVRQQPPVAGPIAARPNSTLEPAPSSLPQPPVPHPAPATPIESSNSTPIAPPAAGLAKTTGSRTGELFSQRSAAVTVPPVTPSGTNAVSDPAAQPADAPSGTVVAPATPDTHKMIGGTTTAQPPAPFNPARLDVLPARPTIVGFATPPRVSLAPRVPALIRPVLSRWTIGAVAMPLNTQQHIEGDPAWQNDPGGPGGRPNPAVDEGTQRGQGWRAGLTADVALNRHWSIGGGLMIRQTSQQSTFKPRLRFMHGEPNHHGGPGGPGGPGHDHDRYEFTYTGYGSGTANEVTFRVESNDPTPNSSPSPHRPLNIEVTTRHEATYLEVPLTAQFQWPVGRWRPFVRAGVAGNFFLQGSASIERVTVNETDFSVEADYQPRVKPKALAPASLAMVGGTGLRYQLTRRIGIGAELWWTRQIAAVSAADDASPWNSTPKVSENMLGLGLGLTYRL